MIHCTKDDFEKEVLKCSNIVLVDFWATWCGPCRMQTKVLEECGEKLESEGVKIVKVDVDENEDLAVSYGVESIPTLLVFKNGEVVNRAVGVRMEAELRRMLAV